MLQKIHGHQIRFIGLNPVFVNTFISIIYGYKYVFWLMF